MTIEKFFKHTGYMPGVDEYNAIRESFYEFNGHELDFYAQWMKKRASGEWDREFERRRFRERG